MYSWEDLLDFETECVVFYLLSEQGPAFSLNCPALILEFLSIVNELQPLTPGLLVGHLPPTTFLFYKIFFLDWAPNLLLRLNLIFLAHH